MKSHHTPALTATEALKQAAMQLATWGMAAGLSDDITFENLWLSIENSSQECALTLFNLARYGKREEVNQLFTPTLQHNLLMYLYKYIAQANTRTGMNKLSHFIQQIQPAWHRCMYEATMQGYAHNENLTEPENLYQLLLATDDWMLSYKLGQMLLKRLADTPPGQQDDAALMLKRLQVQLTPNTPNNSRVDFETTAIALMNLGKISYDNEDPILIFLCQSIANIYLKTSCDLQVAATSGNVKEVNAILEQQIEKNLFVDLFKYILLARGNPLMHEIEMILSCLLLASLAWENYFYDIALQGYLNSQLYQTPDALLVLIVATKDNSMIEYLSEELDRLRNAESRTNHNMKMFHQSRRSSLDLTAHPEVENRFNLSRSM